jgi:hypothetical protein
LAEQRAFALIRLAFIWLSQERQLSPLDAAPGFESILIQKKSRKVSAGERVALTMMRGEDAAIRGVLATFALLQSEIDSSKNQVSVAQSKEFEAKRVADDAVLQLTSAINDLKALRAKHELAQARIMSLEREKETDVLAFHHATGEIRARSLGFVRKKLVPLVDEALDALEGEPSYSDVALNRLQSIKSRLIDEEQWLAHSE